LVIHFPLKNEEAQINAEVTASAEATQHNSTQFIHIKHLLFPLFFLFFPVFHINRIVPRINALFIFQKSDHEL
jgi:hypothetical protein